MKKEQLPNLTSVTPKPATEGSAVKHKVKSILITQPKPEGDKSPYYDIAKKYNVKVFFKPFIQIEPLSGKEFRKQRITIQAFTSIVLMNKQSVDIFFKMVEDNRHTMPESAKYYCITESVALYLQKYIQFRKRKIFFGDGTVKALLVQVGKHHAEGENYFIACSDNPNKEVADFFKKNKYKHVEGVIYRSVPAPLTAEDLNYDVITFFSPVGVQALKHNFPDLLQNGKVFGAFGQATAKAMSDAGYNIQIQAPSVESPSMAMALEAFLKKNK